MMREVSHICIEDFRRNLKLSSSHTLAYNPKSRHAEDFGRIKINFVPLTQSVFTKDNNKHLPEMKEKKKYPTISKLIIRSEGVFKLLQKI